MKTRIKKLALIFLIYLIALTSIAQPGTKVKELKRKRHWLGGTYGHPYTTFDRYNGKAFEETIKEVRRRIKQEIFPSGEPGPVAKAYQQVYNHANTTMPSDNGMPSTGVSELALWAKNNAFVMLIGLKLNGETLTLNERNYHKQKVLDAFDQMTGEIPDYEGKYITFYAGLGLTKIHPLASKILYTATIGQQLYQEMNWTETFVNE